MISGLTHIVANILVCAFLSIVFDTRQAYLLDIFLWTSIFVDSLVNITCISLQYENCGYFDCIYNHCCRSCEKYLKLINNESNDNNDAAHRIRTVSHTPTQIEDN